MTSTTLTSAPRLTAVLLTLAFTAPSANAQMKTPPRLELRPFVGAYVPMGDQSDLLTTGITAGAQAAYALTRHVSAVATFAWSSSEEKNFLGDDINLFQYDVGAELAANKMLSPIVMFRPFVGLGAGGRSYDYTDRESGAGTNVAGYGSIGAQVQLGRVGYRLEARDYISGFKGLSGEMSSSKTRDDVSITSGLTFKF
jgi:hypothetical protein